MTKLLLIALAVALLVWLIFGRRRDAPPRKRGGPPATGAEEMVSCAQCGVHLPRSEALAARGLHYCSGSHRDQVPPPA